MSKVHLVHHITERGHVSTKCHRWGTPDDPDNPGRMVTLGGTVFQLTREHRRVTCHLCAVSGRR
jgi:hypothetical protein